jgi:hypothetical protein
MVPGHCSLDDCEIYYFCEARKDWFLVPDGWVAPMPSGEFSLDDPFEEYLCGLDAYSIYHFCENEMEVTEQNDTIAIQPTHQTMFYIYPAFWNQPSAMDGVIVLQACTRLNKLSECGACRRSQALMEENANLIGL